MATVLIIGQVLRSVVLGDDLRRSEALGYKGDTLCHMGSNGVARFGNRRKASAIKFHDIVFDCQKGKATVTWYENTNRDALVFDNLLHH